MPRAPREGARQALREADQCRLAHRIERQAGVRDSLGEAAADVDVGAFLCESPRYGRADGAVSTATKRCAEHGGCSGSAGYEGTSITDLTAVMGINSPSLYAAFGSKEKLFREAIRLYDTTDGSASERALREGPTARAAIEAMLRENAEIYADPEKPSGCMVVLGTTTWTPHNEAVRDYLADTVLEGLSIQARDGAPRESMHTIIDYAMATWQALLTSHR